MAQLTKFKKILLAIGCLASVSAVAIIYFSLNAIDYNSFYTNSFRLPCDKIGRPSKSESYVSAAVSADGEPCAKIAADILRRNGSVADAAVASVFCIGVVNPQSAGIGGGFLATFYSKEEKKAYALDARETAPETIEKEELGVGIDRRGGLYVGVPGEAIGLRVLYDRFGGKMEWADLIQPSIDLCEKGHTLTWYTGGMLHLMQERILKQPSMSVFTNEDEKRVLHEGEKLVRYKLAESLRALQIDPNALNKGEVGRNFIRDLKKFGGILTEEDLANYKPKWRDPVSFNLASIGLNLYSFPPPGSGIVVGVFLQILDRLNITKSSFEPSHVYKTNHEIVEAFKFSHALRSQLGDIGNVETKKLMSTLSPAAISKMVSSISDGATSEDPTSYGAEIVPGEDQGTAHVSIIGPNGDAIAITSSINYAYGALKRSESTGIIYNNQLADFTFGQNMKRVEQFQMDANRAASGRRPLSSMSPSVIVDEEGIVRMVIGAAGGVRIPSAIGTVAARHLWAGQSVQEATDACRSYHTLLPMTLFYENGYPKDVLQYLEERGHHTQLNPWQSVVGVVGRDSKKKYVANYDHRKSGQIDGF